MRIGYWQRALSGTGLGVALIGWFEDVAPWLDFQAASADDREAFELSVKSARATYASAMSGARSAFKATTGTSMPKTGVRTLEPTSDV